MSSAFQLEGPGSCIAGKRSAHRVHFSCRWKWCSYSTASRALTFSMASAVFTGTVLFSTTILLLLETEAIMRAAPSQYVRSAALPAPTPLVLVGVLTLQGSVSNIVLR